MDERVEEIKNRLGVARPKYPTMRAVLGSGDNLCTAIVAEDPENGHMDFFADIFPDYVIDNLGEKTGEWLDIGFDGYHARLQFLENVFSDMDYLLSLIGGNDEN